MKKIRTVAQNTTTQEYMRCDVADGTLTFITSENAKIDEVVDFLARNKDFFQPFESLKDDEYYTRDFQNKLLEAEVRARKSRMSYRFYIKHSKYSDKIIGTVSLSNVLWGSFRSAIIGYKIDESFNGRGYMTKILNVMLNFAFNELNLHRIEALVLPWNKPSIRVLEKNRFELEGISRECLKVDGYWQDHLRFSRIKIE